MVVARLALVALLSAPLMGVAGSAKAGCVADPYDGTCVTAVPYRVSGTDGTLAVQATPDVDNVTGSLDDGATVGVVCQVNDGGTDSYDGLTSRTWDYTDAGGWVYDHFVTTPWQDPNGWSPGVRHCGEGAAASGPALTPAISVPDLDPRQIVALGHTAGPLFEDGPGFTNAQVPQTRADAERNGACQNLVLANTDYWWLMNEPPLNEVAGWADASRAHGRTVLNRPVVGAVVVFKPGWHDGWDYAQGHVALVMRTYADGGFTIAEFNWHAGGGGTGILDLRRISASDDAPSAFIR